MDVTIIADKQGGRFRVWAAIGNVIDVSSGCTVSWTIEDEGSVEMQFPSRTDAEKFFRALADASATCKRGDAGDETTLRAEGFFDA